jgi:hypothetical protein
VPQSTSTPQAEPTPAPSDTSAPIQYHSIIPLHSATGNQGPSDVRIDVIPVIHTDESTYSTILGEMRKWIGSENVTVLFYRLSPSALPRPAGA